MSVLLTAAAIKAAAPLVKKGIEQVRKNKSINGNGDAPNILGEGQMINVKGKRYSPAEAEPKKDNTNIFIGVGIVMILLFLFIGKK